MQVDVEQLVQGSAHPMVRHAVSPATYDAAWVQGSAVVARGTRHTLALGPPDELVPLMGSLADEFVPDRLTVDAAAYAMAATRPSCHPWISWWDSATVSKPCASSRRSAATHFPASPENRGMEAMNLSDCCTVRYRPFWGCAVPGAAVRSRVASVRRGRAGRR